MNENYNNSEHAPLGHGRPPNRKFCNYCLDLVYLPVVRCHCYFAKDSRCDDGNERRFNSGNSSNVFLVLFLYLLVNATRFAALYDDIEYREKENIDEYDGIDIDCDSRRATQTWRQTDTASSSAHQHYDFSYVLAGHASAAHMHDTVAPVPNHKSIKFESVSGALRAGVL
jgi:hypothetical protein